ncbi:MAG TPA: cupredoxin family copper-binding protein [Acidimicrobiia bacterium]|nr:cupredoxin family copper-binding protein [Acidimicrobiia bacterium]
MKRLLVLAAAVALSMAACSGESTDTTEATGGDEQRVEIADLAFNPETVTVAVGSTVTWVNADPDVPHTSTSDDDVWNSDTLNEGDDFSFTFDEAGTFAYFCEVHPTMRGSIVVE